MKAKEYMNNYLWRQHGKQMKLYREDDLVEGLFEAQMSESPTLQKLETIAEMLWNDYGLLKDRCIAIESVYFEDCILRVAYLYRDTEAYAKLKERTLANM